ncbi:MAG TPA: hypothetical protein VK848_13160, partial [Acidimicrobiia bacterium]|nr:hypothetical protein [Acidimicrobiia bacterium]
MGGPLAPQRATALLVEPDGEVGQDVGEDHEGGPGSQVHIGARAPGLRHPHLERRALVPTEGGTGEGHDHAGGRASPQRRDHGQTPGGQIGVDNGHVGFGLCGQGQ